MTPITMGFSRPASSLCRIGNLRVLRIGGPLGLYLLCRFVLTQAFEGGLPDVAATRPAGELDFRNQFRLRPEDR
jgi:hypothetical protein